MQRVSGFLTIYGRLKNKRSIVIKTKKTKGGKPIRPHSIFNIDDLVIFISYYIVIQCYIFTICYGPFELLTVL